MTNLFIVNFENEDFTILVCADDIEEAKNLAIEYADDAGLDHRGTVKEFNEDMLNVNIDCDYIIV